jgi:hemerythrin-like domain-containing protein
MMPIGPLMIEHRLIEHTMAFLGDEAQRIQRTQEVNPAFIETAVDFIRTYADRTHHGKEEGILFRDLRDRELSADDQGVLEQLIEEHVYARQLVGHLVAAKENYLAGDQGALETILDKVEALVDLYPEHIATEDKVFFLPSMDYFTQHEQDAMLAEMWEFDRKMIHKKYRSVVERLEHDRG